MTFGADTWWLIGTLAAAATGVIGYFLKRTMNKVDRHGDSIHEIQRTYVTKDEFYAHEKEVDHIQQTYVTKSEFNEHDKDINRIKQTYVTKDELKDLKSEFREELKKVAEDVNVIKDKCLYKEDFYRSQKQVNEKLDGINKLIFQLMGVKKDA